jgi:hypothetical protein
MSSCSLVRTSTTATKKRPFNLPLTTDTPLDLQAGVIIEKGGIQVRA